MKYGVFFTSLGSLLALLACTHGGWFWGLLWPAAAVVVVGFAYLAANPHVFGKGGDGRLNRWRLLLFFPYLAPTWGLWHLLRIVRHEEAYGRVAPDLIIGRRLTAGESVPADVTTVIDLTAEFCEPESVRKGRGYLAFPTLDAAVRRDGEFRSLVEEIAAAKGVVYVHCAEGHGRSGTVAAAVLLARRMAGTVDDALGAIRRVRPGVRLNASQRALLERFAKELPN